MVLKYDLKSKEERVNFDEKCKNERTSVRGNIKLQFKNILCENRVSEFIKKIDSMRN